MADLRKMTVEGLRELARKVLGPGHSRKTKSELVAALEAAGEAGGKGAPAKGPARQPARKGARSDTPAEKPAEKPVRQGKAAKAVQAATKAARAGARAAVKAGRAAAEVAEGVRAAVKPRAKARKPGKLAAAAATVAGAAAGLATAARGAAGSRARSRKAAADSEASVPGADPAGFFVARVRGEDAVREAPHPMTETAEAAAEPAAEAPRAHEGEYDERLGDLPWGYGDDAFVALPRDPRTLFLYWDLSRATVHAGFDGLDHPRAQLRVYARAGEGWEPVRSLEFAIESRGYYVHELEPGRVYRAEIHAVDRRGADRVVGRGSNEMMLPPLGPSPVIDDRFIRIPWDMPLGRLLGPGHAGGPFSEEARALLARLSDWSRFALRGGGGSAGGIGGRPGASWPTSPAPTSPGMGFGGGREGA